MKSAVLEGPDVRMEDFSLGEVPLVEGRVKRKTRALAVREDPPLPEATLPSTENGPGTKVGAPTPPMVVLSSVPAPQVEVVSQPPKTLVDKLFDFADKTNLLYGGPVIGWALKPGVKWLRSHTKELRENFVQPLLAGKTGEYLEKVSAPVPLLGAVVKMERAAALYFQGEKIGGQQGEAMQELGRRKLLVGFGKVAIDLILEGTASAAAGAAAEIPVSEGLPDLPAGTEMISPPKLSASSVNAIVRGSSANLTEDLAGKLLQFPYVRENVDAFFRRMKEY